MKASLPDTASCLPTGRPHCTRSTDHSRAIFSDHLAAPEQSAGIESRPALSVVSAIFRPSPSRPRRFSTGTRTWCSRVSPFSRPRSPMNALRRSTVMPGAVPSTTNAVMPPRPPGCCGTRAMTTSSSATTPFVVHSFTPSRRYAVPSSVSVAVLSMRAGSDPTSGSVSRNAEMAPAAHRGRKRSFCSGVPTSLTGSGTPIDWWAEIIAPSEGWTEPMRTRARAYDCMVSPRPPYSVGIFIPKVPMSARARMSSSGIRASRSIRAPSIVEVTSRSLSRNASPRASSSGSGRGCGCTRSRSKRPR